MTRRCRVYMLAVFSGLAIGAVSVASADADDVSCANIGNVGFHANLPDCRAYELVTPPFKDGWAGGLVVGVSTDGQRLVAESLGAFAEAESDPRLGTFYEFTRGESGWKTTALNPPASAFPASELVAASPVQRRSLWIMRRPSQAIAAHDLYLRDETGSFTRVGPMDPPAAELGPPAGSYQLFTGQYIYEGASSDLSRVVFRVENSFNTDLWPGDSTVENGSSLFEYTGVANSRPELLGRAPSGHLISDCGTRLGAPGGTDVYNAVAPSGSAVFFTALAGCGAASAPQSNELYAQLGPGDVVPISEPTPAQCSECVASAESDATFQGASADGTQAFFLSGQEKFSGQGTVNLYEYDFRNPEGHKLLTVSGGALAPEVQGVARVAQDGSHVYFVARAVLTAAPNVSLAAGQQIAEAGANNLYVFERDARYPSGHLTFVARLTEEDAADWGVEDFRPVQATRDGRFLVLTSTAALTPGDPGGTPQVFEYDAASEVLTRVSVGQQGYAQGMINADTAGAVLASPVFPAPLRPSGADHYRELSEDGGTVIFTSTGALTSDAHDAAEGERENLYEYRRGPGTTKPSITLVAGGSETLFKEVVGLDSTGANIYFEAGMPLLPTDVDTQYDLYDARAEGGFAAQMTVPPCQEEACHGDPAPTPAFASPGSEGPPIPEEASGQAKPVSNGTSPASSDHKAAALKRLKIALRSCRRRSRGNRPSQAKKRALCERRARHRHRMSIKDGK